MERHFDEDLKTLKERTLYMGQTALDMLEKSSQALRDRNPETAKEIFELEKIVNHLHVEVDEHCVRLFALHQPMAGDLRFLAAVMKINADLERIGDQAVNAALRYRAQAPLLDSLLKEIGIEGDELTGLTAPLHAAKTLEADTDEAA